MKNIVLYKKGEFSWVRYIKKRILNNLNFLAIAEGPTGIGKSWFLISLAHELDSEFESRQIAFSFQKVMEIINSDWFQKKKWKIIIFDEAQTEISNRQWQSLTNKLMNYLLSTFRHQNIILLFTSPYSDFLDSQTMKLIHCKFEVRSHSRRTKQTRVRPKLLQYNPQKKKFYEHSLFTIKDGKAEKIVYWKINKPPKHLIEPYEKDKVEFTDKLNKDILEELSHIREKKIDTRKPLTELQRKSLLAYKKIGNQKEVGKLLGITQDSVSRCIKSARKKGYTLENIDMGANY